MPSPTPSMKSSGTSVTTAATAYAEEVAALSVANTASARSLLAHEAVFYFSFAFFLMTALLTIIG